MKKNLIGLLFLCILLQGYSDDAYIDTTYDEFEEFTIIKTNNNLLFSPIGVSVWLNVSLHIDSKKDTSLYLTLLYCDDDWLFIKDGYSMKMVVDDERLQFKSVADRDDVEGGMVTEFHLYTSDKLREDLCKIAYADSVKIKLIGRKYYTLLNFRDENFEIFRKFLEEVLHMKNPKDTLEVEE